MCDELNNEVENGNSTARQLAEHVYEMGAAMAQFSATVENIDFGIIVKREYPPNVKVNYTKVVEIHSDATVILANGKKFTASMDAEGTYLECAYLECGMMRLYIRIGDTLAYV
jgi:hypothetical protein